MEIREKCKCGWPELPCMKIHGTLSRPTEDSTLFGNGNICDPSNKRRCIFKRWYPLLLAREYGRDIAIQSIQQGD